MRQFIEHDNVDRSRLNPKSLEKETALSRFVFSHSSTSHSSWTPRRRSEEFWNKVDASTKSAKALAFLSLRSSFVISGSLLEQILASVQIFTWFLLRCFYLVVSLVVRGWSCWIERFICCRFRCESASFILCGFSLLNLCSFLNWSFWCCSWGLWGVFVFLFHVYII